MASVIASSWMDPIISYIANGSLPYEPKEVDRVWRKAAQFWLLEEKRYTDGLMRDRTFDVCTLML